MQILFFIFQMEIIATSVTLMVGFQNVATFFTIVYCKQFWNGWTFKSVSRESKTKARNTTVRTAIVPYTQIKYNEYRNNQFWAQKIALPGIDNSDIDTL